MSYRQIKPELKCSFLYLTVSWFIMLSACGDGTLDTDVGALPLKISYHRAEDSDPRAIYPIECDNAGIKTIEADVYDADGSSLATGGPWDCEEHTGSVEPVKVGENRMVVVYAKDDQGDIVFRGDETIPTVVAGPNPAVAIDCSEFIPTLQSPGHDTVVTASAMKLQWSTVDGGEEYHLSVSETNDLSEPIIEHWIKDVTFMPEPSELSIDKIYYWQVYVIDEYGRTGKGSEIWTFTSAIIPGILPDTGQIDSYTDIPGEDSDYTINPPAFIKLDETGNELDSGADAWAMVRDDVTGLTWEVKTNDATIHDIGNLYTWQQSQDDLIAQLNTENFGGHGDWRLPTIEELATFVNYNAQQPAVDLKWFRIDTDECYWSSSESTTEGSAWNLCYYYGRTRSIYSKTTEFHAIAVRGNKTGYNLINALLDNGDGTVTDGKTGLTWQKEARPEQATWQDALAYCNDLVLGPYEDWRLPNIRELQSIVEYDRIYPAIDTTIFVGTNSDDLLYWSSTSHVGSLDTLIWHTDFKTGETSNSNSAEEGLILNVRAVRGGQ